MGYLSLYRKYRPQTFADMVGQQHVVRTLTNALNSGRVGHAYLFAGPRGTGKTTAARLLAKGLNCALGPTGNPCNQCESCIRITAGNAMDVIEIDGASNRGIDEVRDVRENVRFSPAESRAKVYIIDEVHMLTHEAFNALLKVLEEPPKHVIFVFATTESHKIPATILSRCQRFDFMRFSVAEIAGRLAQVAEAEGIQCDPHVHMTIARQAEGGMRDALGILDQCVAYGSGKVTVADVLDVVGAAPRETILELAQTVLARDISSALRLVAQLYDDGRDLRQCVRDLVRFLRDVLVVKVAPNNPSLTSLAPAEEEAAKRMAAATALADLLGIIEQLSVLETDMRWTSHARLSLETALVRLCAGANKDVEEHAPVQAVAGSNELLQSLTSRLEALERRVRSLSGAGSPTERTAPASAEGDGGQPTSAVEGASPARKAQVIARPGAAPPVAPRGAQPSSGSGLQLPAVEAVWSRLLVGLKEERFVHSEALLREGKPVAVRGKTVYVSFPEAMRFHQTSLQMAKHRQPVERVLSRLVGQEVQIETCIGVPETLMDEPEKPEEPASGMKVETYDQDEPRSLDPAEEPLLQAALRIFGGRVVEVREITDEVNEGGTA